MLTPLTPVDAADPPRSAPHLAAALDGGSPLLPYAGAPPALPASRPESCPRTWPSPSPPPARRAAEHALLTAAALRAGASRTQSVLGGPGQWLLAVPGPSSPGSRCLSAPLLAGTTPAVLERDAGFRPSRFAAATARLGTTRPTSLVPTQVARLLDEPSGTAALRRYAAVLVGALRCRRLRARADAAGVRLVATYGMTETAGGCVYDDGRTYRDDDRARSRRPDRPRRTDAGRRLSRRPAGHGRRLFPPGRARRAVPDRRPGIFGADGRLQVLAAATMSSTPAVKVNPRLVEMPRWRPARVRQVVVVGLPDPEWGEVVLDRGAGRGRDPHPRRGARAAAGVVPAYGLPRAAWRSWAVPEQGPGKPDRRAVARAFRRDEVGQ